MNAKINKNPEASISVDSTIPQIPLELKPSTIITYTTIYERSMRNSTKKRQTTPDDCFFVDPIDMVRDWMATIRKSILNLFLLDVPLSCWIMLFPIAVPRASFSQTASGWHSPTSSEFCGRCRTSSSQSPRPWPACGSRVSCLTNGPLSGASRNSLWVRCPRSRLAAHWAFIW